MTAMPSGHLVRLGGVCLVAMLHWGCAAGFLLSSSSSLEHVGSEKETGGAHAYVPWCPSGCDPLSVPGGSALVVPCGVKAVVPALGMRLVPC